jgi:NADPH:quinone reductase-like Zn-dependent oxidoreductase
MKTTFIDTFGAPDVVTTGDLSIRQPAADEALVRIEAASVNPLDVKIIAGYMQQVFPVTFPYAPGSDFSGVVEAVGANVTHVAPGDRVMGRSAPTAGGAFATKLVIEADALRVIPAVMSFEQAAALPTAFGTAHQALFEAGKLRAGQRVLIHAGAGGVGSMAVQQARHAGAYVIATASGKNIDLLKSLGADEAIDYRTQDFTTLRDIDLVLDPIGGETLDKSWSVLRENGRIVTLVEFGIQGKSGRTGEAVFFADARRFLDEAIHMFRADRLQIVIDSVFPLDDARAALEKVATGHVRGKVVIRMRG